MRHERSWYVIKGVVYNQKERFEPGRHNKLSTRWGGLEFTGRAGHLPRKKKRIKEGSAGKKGSLEIKGSNLWYRYERPCSSQEAG